jgi:sugar lactone lactonase YvrE
MSAAPARLLVDSRCELGEGIVWSPAEGALYWVDIEGAALWRHDLARGLSQQWAMPQRLACLALASRERLLLGLADGLYWIDRAALDGDATLAPNLLCTVEARLPTRLNDGRVDRHGAFVFGTKSEADDGAAVGAYYQYSAAHGLRRLALPSVAIPNSICFDATGATLYFCDSRQPRILCCDYDSANAQVGAVRTFVELDVAGASPDGSIIDAEGYLWNAQWGASRVVRYSPAGAIDQVIPLPVSQPSCCAIGGEDGDQLFITSAWEGLDPAALAQQPHAGGVYVAALAAPLRRGEAEVLLR